MADLEEYTAFKAQEPNVIYQHGIYPRKFLECVTAVEIDGIRFEKADKYKELIRGMSRDCCSRCIFIGDCDNVRMAHELGCFDD